MGMWRLSATDRAPEDLNSQIRDLLSKLTDDLTVWTSIAERYRVDLFCGLFMRECNEGLSIIPESLTALGLRESSSAWIYTMDMIESLNQSLLKGEGTRDSPSQT